MIDVVEMDFAFNSEADLESLEVGMRAVEGNVKIARAILAVSLGRIKREGLYLAVAPSFRQYLKLERTTLPLKTAEYLAAVGEAFWKYRSQLKDNGIRLSSVMSKIPLLPDLVADRDPMCWVRMNELSKREFKSYVERQAACLTGRTSSVNQNEISAPITVSGSSLAIGGKRVRGINLNEVRSQTNLGMRAVIHWVLDDNAAKRLRRVVSKVV